MSKLEFVDTHIHFWDLQHPDLRYEPGESNYSVDDYIAETRSSNVTKAVHVQAAVGMEDPVDETKWLQEAVDRTGFPHAIVAHADLRDPGVETVLERHCEFPNVRGIRDFSRGDYLVASDFHRGYALLEKFNLVASLDVKWQDMRKERDLADKFSNIRLVFDHAGFPTERTDEYFQNWRQGLRTLSEAENVVCKISGLGMCDNNWTVDSIRPWVLECIEVFGPRRCVFATNWPVDSLWSTYEAVIDAYTEIIGDFTDDEKVAMFSGNASEIYRL